MFFFSMLFVMVNCFVFTKYFAPVIAIYYALMHSLLGFQNQIPRIHFTIVVTIQ